MPKYRVTVTETCVYVLYIEAPSAEAIETDTLVSELVGRGVGFIGVTERDIEPELAPESTETLHFTLD